MSNLDKQIDILVIKISMGFKQYAKAIARLDLALKKRPDDIWLLNIAQHVYKEACYWDEFYKLQERIIELYSSNVLLRQYVATLYMSGSNFDVALPHLVYCVENWNLDETYSHMLGNTYARLAICYAHVNRWQDFEMALQKAKALASWDPDIAYAHILSLVETSKSEDLGMHLDVDLEKHPRLHALYFWKGLYTQHYLHDSRKAIDMYEYSLQRISSVRSGRNYWRDYFATMEYAIPWDILKQGVEACIEIGDTRRALRLVYQSKFSIWDGAIDIGLFKMYIAVLEGKLISVEKRCRQILEKQLRPSKKIEYWLLLAQAQLKQGKHEESLSSAKQALALNPDKKSAWVILGYIQKMRKDWQGAAKTYLKMITMNRFDFRTWKDLGLCYLNIGDLPSAKQAYEHAVQINSFDADAWVELANIYLQLDEKDMALSSYQTGLSFEWLSADNRNHAQKIISRFTS